MFIAHTISEFQQSFNMCWPDVHGRSRFAKLSIRVGSKVKIAPVHSDFNCDFGSLPLHGPPKESKFRRREVSKGLQSYIRPVCADCLPAGPDGNREQGSYLMVGLIAQGTVRNAPRSGLTCDPSHLVPAVLCWQEMALS